MKALQRAVADACLARDAGAEIARDLGGFLAARGVSPADVDAIAASPPGLLVYRSLVRNRLSSVVLQMLPRTRARMNTALAGRFDAELASFVDEVGPRTHYLRDVPREFFLWAEPRWRSDLCVPGYLCDLAAHELAHFAIASAEPAVERSTPGESELSLDRGLAFSDSVRAATYAWRVHELSLDTENADVPDRRDVSLLGYRDADHRVRWLELTALAAAVVERLLAHETLGTSVAQACAAHGVPPGQVVEPVARLLADLGGRGVIVGTMPGR